MLLCRRWPPSCSIYAYTVLRLAAVIRCFGNHVCHVTSATATVLNLRHVPSLPSPCPPQLELLTSRDPFEMAQCGNNLVDEFVSVVEKNGVKAMIDTILLEEGNIDEIKEFARLALKCVAKNGEKRPSMISVVEELWQIQDQLNNRSAFIV
ncbi:hypothetical protein KSS87_011436 [Heliosperma pusillum]|nr:hypothetical protein KSS87_011436 [Heliosperma pusillum]